MDKNSIKLVPLAVEGYRMEYPDGYSIGRLKGVTEADAQEIARRWNHHPKLVEALRQAIVCVETGADDSEEAGYPSRAESMREDAAAYRAILNELNREN